MLVDRVEDAKVSQEGAKEQFASALVEFPSVTKYEGDDLKRSEHIAREVTARIDSIEGVAGSLFREWQSELDHYTSQALRASSEKQLESAWGRYDHLIVVMRRAARTGIS